MSIGVLFVCLGNICRSPAAEGAFKDLVKKHRLQSRFNIDSCGTAGYHIGELAHSTTRSVARRHGIILDSRARQFHSKDFSNFDYILAMDHHNYESLEAMTSPDKERGSLHLFRSFDPDIQAANQIPDVPDPYYGGLDGFEEVQTIVWRTSKSLLEHITKKHKLL